jgi:hypothetical protein
MSRFCPQGSFFFFDLNWTESVEKEEEGGISRKHILLSIGRRFVRLSFDRRGDEIIVAVFGGNGEVKRGSRMILEIFFKMWGKCE